MIPVLIYGTDHDAVATNPNLRCLASLTATTRWFASSIRRWNDYGVGRTSFLTDWKLVVGAKVDDTCVVCEVDFLVSFGNGKVPDIFDKSTLFYI